MAEKKQSMQYVRVAVLPDTPLPPAEGANYFHFVRVGTEIQMLVGSVNLLQFHEARQRSSGEVAVVVPDISHRFLMSSLGFQQLKAQLDENRTNGSRFWGRDFRQTTRMTTPTGTATVAPPITDETESTSSVYRLPIPGSAYAVRPAEDRREAVICEYDLQNAATAGNAVLPVWTDPNLLIPAYGLDSVRDKANQLLTELFGPTATLTPDLEMDPDARAPTLVFRLRIPAEKTALKLEYVRRYVREIQRPENAPIPVLLWGYDVNPA